ncbi:YwaF family protein [Posidoniimonas polymericola]|nr:TIGR02206 family membrane protein [Posidoniimonas polymericola]
MSHFSAEHLACLATVVGMAVLLPIAGRAWPGRTLPAGVGAGLAMISASGYLLWLVAVVWLGAFVPTRDLPLEFCYVVGIVAPFALLTRSQVAFDFLYYGATSGVLHACITPVFAPSFPHPRFFAFWALHGGAVVTAIFAILALGRRPSYQGIFTTVGVIACVLCVVIPVNQWFGANYFYLREKPAGSVQELLGPWPTYVTATMLLGLVNFHLAYLPFALSKRTSPCPEPQPHLSDPSPE